MSKGFVHILLILIIIVIGAGLIGYIYFKQVDRIGDTQETVSNAITSLKKMDVGSSKITFKKVSEPKLLFSGGYADPTYIKLNDKHILYLNSFGKPPTEYQVHTSSDGLTWTKGKGTFPQISTGRAVKFGNQVRLYYPGLTPIKPSDPPSAILSAISDDGYNFKKETGNRIDPRAGYYLEGPTVLKLKNGTYRMYFSENETDSKEKRISAIWGASSDDGLNWTRDKDVTLEATVKDENIPSDWPQALHPFVLTREDGSYLMFYNTHSEVFAATSDNGLSWTKLGKVGVHGADVDGYYKDDGTIRLYYGDFSPQTSGVVYTVDISEVSQ